MSNGEGKRYDCEKCECNEHADSCHYNQTVDEFPDDHYAGGGGVCDRCKHATTGEYTLNWAGVMCSSRGRRRVYVSSRAENQLNGASKESDEPWQI